MTPFAFKAPSPWRFMVLAALGLGLGACTSLRRPETERIVEQSVPSPQRETRFSPPKKPVAPLPRGERAMADYYYRQGDYKRSIALLSDAVAKREGDAVLWRNLGSAYAMDDDFDNAVVCFQRAIKRDPRDVRSYYDLSVVQGWQGDPSQAEHAAERGLQLDPNHGGLHSSLGNDFDDQGKEDMALGQYAQALKINPADTITRFNRGGLYFKLRDLNDAERDFDTVLKQTPLDLEAAQNLAAVYILQNRLPEAERLNQWVIAHHPKDEDTLENAYFNLGIVYDRQDRIQKALNMYQLALQVAPWDAAAYVNAAVILERLDRRSEALAYWEKYQRLFPVSRRAKQIAQRIAILRRMVALEKGSSPSGARR